LARTRILVTQGRTQDRVKTKLQDKQTRTQQVKRSLSLLDTILTPYFPLKGKAEFQNKTNFCDPPAIFHNSCGMWSGADPASKVTRGDFSTF